MPVCSKCHLDKPLDAFNASRSRSAGHESACKTCQPVETYKQQFAARGGPLTVPKRCAKCRATKPYTEFRCNPRHKDGLEPWCHSCEKSRRRIYYRLTTHRKTREPLHIRFWRMVDTTGGPDACWPWEGLTNKDGYGVSKHSHRGQSTGAHRVAWEITFGDIPKGEEILHSCDTPPCCNPRHLFKGTQKENMADCSIKGRSCSQLTLEQVRLIRSFEGIHTPREIATMFPINRTSVYNIWQRKTFRHIG